MSKHLLCIVTQAFFINKSIRSVLVKYSSVNHSHQDVATLGTVAKHCIIVKARHIVNRIAINQNQVCARTDRDLAAILASLRQSAVTRCKLWHLRSGRSGGIQENSFVQNSRCLHFAKDIQTVIRGNTVGAKAHVNTCGKELAKRHYTAAELEVADGVMNGANAFFCHNGNILIVYPNTVCRKCGSVESTEIVKELCGR